MAVTNFIVDGALHEHRQLEAQLQAAFEIVPGYAWYALPNAAPTFLNERTAEPVRSANGTLLYWMGVDLDTEERKPAEFYLAEGQRLDRTRSWALPLSDSTTGSRSLVRGVALYS